MKTSHISGSAAERRPVRYGAACVHAPRLESSREKRVGGKADELVISAATQGRAENGLRLSRSNHALQLFMPFPFTESYQSSHINRIRMISLTCLGRLQDPHDRARGEDGQAANRALSVRPARTQRSESKADGSSTRLSTPQIIRLNPVWNRNFHRRFLNPDWIFNAHRRLVELEIPSRIDHTSWFPLKIVLRAFLACSGGLLVL